LSCPQLVIDEYLPVTKEDPYQPEKNWTGTNQTKNWNYTLPDPMEDLDPMEVAVKVRKALKDPLKSFKTEIDNR